MKTADLDAMRILDNAPNGELPDDQEDYPGAFVPLNNDDDDYDATNTPDYQQTGPIVGESDLLPIIVHAISPSSLGGNYRLHVPSNLRVWENGTDRTVAVPDLSVFPATSDRTLYVEGVSPGGGILYVDWWNDYESKPAVDTVSVTVFEWTGPLNVPDYSIYKYRATGGQAGMGNSFWIGAYGGHTHASIEGDTAPDEIDIHWDVSPNVGKAVYYAGLGYAWDLEVNVVDISFGTPNDARALGSPFQLDGAGSALIRSSNDPSAHAMEARITVASVEGPTVNGVQRGKKFMELGLSHQARMDAQHADYNDSAPPQRVRCSLEDGLMHWDVRDQSTIPWTFLNAQHHLDITSDSQVVLNYEFSTYDRPTVRTTNQFVLNGDQADVLVPVMQHSVPFIVRTKDPRVIDPSDVRTERAILEWRFDGTGKVDAAGAWSLTGTGVTVAPTFFTLVYDGRRLPDGAPNLREARATQTWIQENQ